MNGVEHHNPQPGAPLTAHEIEVLQASADGHSIRATATRLGIRASDVAANYEQILSKLGALDRAHAVACGFRAGLLT